MMNVSTAPRISTNPVIDAILRRRSVREGFSDAPVPSAILEDIVRCGLAAPSSKNARPSRFHVVTDPRVLDELAGAVESGEDVERYVPYDPMTGQPRPEWQSTVIESAAVLRGARAAIFIENAGTFSRGRQALVNASKEALQASIVGYTLEVLGVGAAIQNLWVAAVAHGLSGVFMGDVLIAERAIQRRLGIACDLVGVLALGYSEVPNAELGSRRADLDHDRVRWISPGGPATRG